MNYALRYEKRVLKDLDRIPKKDLSRIDRIIQSLAFNPLPRGAKKLSGEKEFYRIRQGDYRIVYTADFQAKIISILGVRHRKEAYR